jgi:predicted nucleic acid-binding protein
MLVTLDSSVIVAALRDQEPNHQQARRILDEIQRGEHLAIQPLTVLVEVTAAIRRRTGSPELAKRVHRDLSTLGTLQFLEIDRRRADEAATIAQETGVRGMDAIVVQIAQEFGTTLFSLDDEMIERVRGRVAVASAVDY